MILKKNFRLGRCSPEKNRPLLVTFKELEMSKHIIIIMKSRKYSVIQ